MIIKHGVISYQPVITRPLYSDLGTTKRHGRNLLVIAWSGAGNRPFPFSFRYDEELVETYNGPVGVLYFFATFPRSCRGITDSEGFVI